MFITMHKSLRLVIVALALTTTIITAYIIAPRLLNITGGALGFYVSVLTMFMAVAVGIAMVGIVTIHIREHAFLQSLIHELVLYRLEEKASTDKALGAALDKMASETKFQVARELGLAREVKPRRLVLPRIPVRVGMKSRNKDRIDWI